MILKSNKDLKWNWFSKQKQIFNFFFFQFFLFDYMKRSLWKVVSWNMLSIKISYYKWRRKLKAFYSSFSFKYFLIGGEVIIWMIGTRQKFDILRTALTSRTRFESKKGVSSPTRITYQASKSLKNKSALSWKLNIYSS